MGNLLREIKWAYQRVVRRYDERIMWELGDYFDYFVPPLKEFCEKQLTYKDLMKLDPQLKRILLGTLKRINALEKMTLREIYEYPNSRDNLWKYVGAHIGYYWD